LYVFFLKIYLHYRIYFCVHIKIRKLLKSPVASLYFAVEECLLMRWAGHVARVGAVRKVYRILVGKPERKRLLGRPTHRWEDGIRMDLREIGWGGAEWIHLAQDRDRWRAVVNAVMNLWVLAPRS
jgi:hypothetical protein